MCGICGVLPHVPSAGPDLMALVKSMSDTLEHRGPDDAGHWAATSGRAAFSHRRLSILDLSPLGHQPMTSACGRFTICYNGEVYNHQAMRRELAGHGHSFRGESDTETLLAAIAQWGLNDAVGRMIGMFAFALWDDDSQTLHLVRDRLGIKPLYYAWSREGDFLFGSELKALLMHPDYDPDIDRDALGLYFRHNYVPAPHSIYEKTRKLEPGCILSLDTASREPELHRYWSVDQIWRDGAANPIGLGEEEAASALESLLMDSVSQRMISDVPIGAFLSGGIDSSCVAALMQANSQRPVRTFSIGFHDKQYNEAHHAKNVAAHLGTDHTELFITPEDLLDSVTDIPRYWDEPFADSSQIPTLCLSRLTRQHVTVALSGDGGDELFNGYERHLFINRVWRTVSGIPLPLRRAMVATGKSLPASLWKLLGPIGPKIAWRLEALKCGDFRELYHFLFSHQRNPEAFVPGSKELPTAFTRPATGAPMAPLQAMSLLDLQTYLPDDILTKVDRASMAASLEARVPLLDHRVVEFAARLPLDFKVRGGVGKILLRQVLYKYVPRELVDRPKMGFGVPIDRWMRHELRDWCESLLDERTLREQGYLNVEMVRTMWREYLNGQRNWFSHLWDVLMFQAWLDSLGKSKACS